LAVRASSRRAPGRFSISSRTTLRRSLSSFTATSIFSKAQCSAPIRSRP
jgi:hypothetical protein